MHTDRQKLIDYEGKGYLRRVMGNVIQLRFLAKKVVAN
jgi:hypothetical protein